MNVIDVIRAFADHCGRCACDNCRYYHFGSTVGECVNAYMEQVDSGEMTLEDSFEEGGAKND